MNRISLWIVLLPALCSCMTKRYVAREYKYWQDEVAPPENTIEHSLFLIGDVGDPYNMEPNLEQLSEMIQRDTASTTVFLGDNLYQKGMPPEGNPERPEAEKRMDRILETVKDYPGNVFFIPGNHDWAYMGREGWERVLIQETYIEDRLNRGNTFVPDNACPGPFRVSVNDNTVLIFLDSQWWLHKHAKPYGDPSLCNAINYEDVVVQLRDIVQRNKGRHIIVMAHHPLFTNGNHGGYYNALDHIFPLRILQNSWFMYVPLPVIGSLYPLFRKFGGSEQDLPNYTYQQMKNAFMEIFSEHKDIIYVAGHEHSLQYFRIGNFHTIVSGSGCKVTPVRKGGQAGYIQKSYGFVRLNIYHNQEVWAEYYTIQPGSRQSQLSFRTRLYSKGEVMPEAFCSLSEQTYADSTVSVAAAPELGAGSMKRWLLGRQYRRSWQTPVNVPLIDLRTEKGGIIPYAIGGGRQTLSLRFKNVDEQEYVARMVVKNNRPEKLSLFNLRQTFVDDLLQDQTSAQHPYGALTIPPMAAAIGLLHTRPTLGYIPADSCLGPYLSLFGNTLVLFEEDPDESHSDAAHLGYASNIVGTDKLLRELRQSNKRQVDQKALVKARLFDMWTGDWDRHENQFRWTEFPDSSHATRYVPVPEDRDQVYFRFRGLLPYLVSRPWAARMLQSFDYDYGDIIGLNTTARRLDRRLLSELNESDWLQAAKQMRQQLSDPVIGEGIGQLPPEVFRTDGPEIISKLQSRRDKLSALATTYYRILSRYVDVYGSNEAELFQLQYIDGDSLRIRVFRKPASSQPDTTLLYQRTVRARETKEVRLYGLGGNDWYELFGESRTSPLIRIICGNGLDSLSDRSRVKSPGKHLQLYANAENIHLVQTGGQRKVRALPDPDVNDTGQDQFFYNYTGPVADFTYNEGDGFFPEIGVVHKRYKFRSNPYGSRHRLTAGYASATNSFKVSYSGDFKNIHRQKDLLILSDFFLPYFAMNYFGYGNSSPKPEGSPAQYRVQMRYGMVCPAVVRRFTSFFQTGIGPRLSFFDLSDRSGTYISEDYLPARYFDPQWYAGIKGFFRIGETDSKQNPTRGLVFQGTGEYNQGLYNAPRHYTHWESDFRFYISPNLPFQLTFAGRIGVAMNTGHFTFYQANSLGGTTNLRGYQQTRFTGDRSFYQNAEVRVQILTFNAYILSGKLGLSSFADNGRVWPGSGSYHQGYGGGIWLSMLNQLVISSYYGLSKEGNVLNVRVGFLF